MSQKTERDATTPAPDGPPPDGPPPQAGRGRRSLSPLWHNPAFVKLWAGQSVSLMGSSVTTLAIPLTAIYTLHAGAEQIGILKTLQWLPYLLISLWAGAWSDRHRRRPLMVGSNLGQALVLGAVVGLALGHLLTLPILLAAVFITGTLTVLFDLSYSAYVPATVGRELLVPANSRLQASASVALIAGPGLGGLLVQLVTAPVALLADAASFVLSSVSLVWIRGREPVPQPRPDEAGIVSQIRIGLRVVFKDPLLRALVGTSAFFNLFSQWMAALIILFAVRDLGLHAGTIGVMTGGGAVGALIGSFLAGPASRRFGIGMAVMGSVVGECLVLLAIPFAPASQPALAALLIGTVLAVSGLGSALSSIVGTSVRQAVTPQHLIGRMTATYRFVSFGVIALGSLCGGIFGQLLGLRAGLLVGAVGVQSTIVWMALSALPRVRQLPQAPPAAGEPGATRDGAAEPAAVVVDDPAGRILAGPGPAADAPPLPAAPPD